MLKRNNKDIRTMSLTLNKVNIKFEQILLMALVFPLSALKK